MAVCSDFTSFGNALGLTLENGTAMNIKQVHSYKDKTARLSANALSPFVYVHIL